MTKPTDINEYRQRTSPMAPTLRGSGALFWVEPGADATPDTLRKLPDDQIAAILIKGLFAIYHLSREHAELPRKVPGYLYAYAQKFEAPIIPVAETLYERYYFGRPFQCGDDIPADLMDLGFGTVEDAGVCVHHAQKMHRLLVAFADDAAHANRLVHRLFSATGKHRRARTLLPLFEACGRWSLDRQRMKPV